MAVWFLAANENDESPIAEFAVMADSVTETAFGPLIRPTADLSAIDALTEFCEWLELRGHTDPRRLGEDNLRDLYASWLRIVEGS